MPTRDELLACNSKEILVQLRMAVAVLEERTTDLPAVITDVNQRLKSIESDNKWIKRIVYSAVPVAPILATVTALLARVSV